VEEHEAAAPPQGDAVEGRTAAEAEAILGETGALPEESAEDDAATLRRELEAEQAIAADLRRELEAERQRAAEQLQARARTQADFDNYRRRMLTEQARWRDDAVADALRQLLPVFDNLERATQAAGELDAVKQGVDLTLRQLRGTLGTLGLEEIEVGEHAPFDPTRHEAMMQVESAEHAEGEVVRVERRGYSYKGALLRPALVAVAKAPAGRGDPA
jgi:molecular chaperone GrpE